MRTFRYLKQGTGLILVLFLIVLVMPSCKPASQAHHPPRLANTGQPAIHAVHSARLKEIMTKLNTPTFNRMPEELEDPYSQDHYFRQVEQTAQLMAEAISDICPAVCDKLSLNKQQKKLFVSLTEKLLEQASELKKIALQKDIDQIDQAMDAIASTCNACHSAFRIMVDEN